MFKQRQRGLRRSDSQRLPVQSIFKDGFHVLIGIGFHCERSGTGSFETLRGITLS
jgi:hypothetical protein